MRATLDFLLNDWLRVRELCSRSRFADHSVDTFAAVLDTAEKIAKGQVRAVQPPRRHRRARTETEILMAPLRVVLPQATHEAWAAYAESGMLSAAGLRDRRHAVAVHGGSGGAFNFSTRRR